MTVETEFLPWVVEALERPTSGHQEMYFPEEVNRDARFIASLSESCSDCAPIRSRIAVDLAFRAHVTIEMVPAFVDEKQPCTHL